MAEAGITYKDIKQATVVVGPPGSGKTTYVRDRAGHGDMILDLDRIFVALTGLPKYNKPAGILPFALCAYDAVISQAAQSLGDVKHLWIIASAPTKEERKRLVSPLNAELVIMDTDAETCVRRIKQDPHRASTWKYFEEIVKKWWSRYEKE